MPNQLRWCEERNRIRAVSYRFHPDQVLEVFIIMGDAKRRKEALGDKYGQEENIFPWLPITKSQSEQFVKWTTKGAWIGIGFLAVWWLTVRLIGPAFGWWEIN